MASTRTVQTLRRVLGLAVVLAKRSTRGARVADLVSELGISRATLYRDFETLRAAGLDVEHCEVEGERRVRLALGHKMPSLGPDFREQLALKLMRQANPKLAGTFVSDALDALLKPSTGFDAKPARGPRKTGPTADILDTIARSIRTKRRLTFRYRGTHDQTEEKRVVDPLELRLVADQLYLVAWDLERDAPRTFKPMRMSAAFALPDAAKKHAVDVEALLAGSVRVWDGQPVEVVVRVSQDKARFVTEWPLHPEQRLETQGNGTVLVRATVAGLVETLRWVLSWGSGATVVEPQALLDAVLTELEGALKGYGAPKQQSTRAGDSLRS